MILEALLRMVFGLLETMINIIPVIDLSFDIRLGALEPVLKYLGYVLPMTDVMICLTVFLVLDNAKFFIQIFNFIIRKIPGLS